VFERFTERARQVVVLAQDEAMALQHNYIGTEHILLGVVRENRGVAARILLDFDADAETVRNEIIRMLSGSKRPRYELDLERASREEHEETLAFSTEHEERVGPEGGSGYGPRVRRPEMGRTSSGPLAQRTPSLLLGWALGTFSLGVGILIGWAIWGL
jgi:Clp amino terminal domain, pathogenicity island component